MLNECASGLPLCLVLAVRKMNVLCLLSKPGAILTDFSSLDMNAIATLPYSGEGSCYFIVLLVCCACTLLRLR